MELLHPEPRPRTTDRVGFEPTVPLRAHRFSRPAVSTTHAPVRTTRRLDAQTPRRPDPVHRSASRRLRVFVIQRIGWDSNPRNGYPFTRSPGACLQPLGHLSELLDAQTHRLLDAQTHRRTDAQTRSKYQDRAGFATGGAARGTVSQTGTSGNALRTLRGSWSTQ